MTRDTVFLSEDGLGYESFVFDQKVAEVFDDMVARSVPSYDQIQRLTTDLVARFADGGVIYDLGCSTGTTLDCLIGKLRLPSTLVGIDDSPHMLKEARTKLARPGTQHRIELIEADLTRVQELPHGEASAVILVLVLQFLRPLERAQLLNRLQSQIREGGVIIVVEKTIQEGRRLNSAFIELYHALKRENGYSDGEISRKREALENRLIPFREQENLQLLEQAGFSETALFFSWLNFQGYVAIK